MKLRDFKIDQVFKNIFTCIASLLIGLVAAYLITSLINGTLIPAKVQTVDCTINNVSVTNSSEEESNETHSDEQSLFSVGPGDNITVMPTVTNTGDTDAYVFLTIEQPLCINPEFREGTDAVLEPDGSSPLYIWALNTNWVQVEEEIQNEKLCTTFAYENILKPGNTTEPVFSSLSMQNITIACYSKIDDINYTINTIVGAVSAFEGCTSSTDRWIFIIENSYAYSHVQRTPWPN